MLIACDRNPVFLATRLGQTVLPSAWLGLWLLAAAVSHADEEPNAEAVESMDRIEQVLVIGVRQRVPGSGSVVVSEELERFDHTDINQVMSAIPGVYVREEDGFGLRPNIGIRGAAAERSQKVTIMEDGVLITPAPYSAPAAYYVPNVSRISRVEVLKGPSAIRHGPHTVGGAINLVTRDVPGESLLELDMSLGTDAFHKAGVAYGGPLGQSGFGFLIEGLRYASDGFKALDGGGDTGFARNDVRVKIRWEPTGGLDQRLTLKLGFADEDADETYLGLTDEDFRADPNRRYRASQLARFQTEHFSAHLNYGLALGRVSVNAKAYWNRFERQWNKLDGFVAGRSLQSILASPHRFTREYSLLVGAADSLPVDAQTLDVTNNDRVFTAEGVQMSLAANGLMGALEHNFTLGVRLHRDDVKRNHQPRGYLMQGGDLVWDGVGRPPKLWNRADTLAVAAFAAEELRWRDLTLTLGLRYENIDGEWEDLRHGMARKNKQSVLSPGLGLHWQITESLGLLAGAYRGFSPAGPGASGVDPERSLNFEAGFRLQGSSARLEAVGFFSDYENLLGRCRVSDSGCQPGEEFNGGRVEVYGAELSAGWTFALTPGLSLDADMVYTYTDSAFQTGFLSGFPQWGLVREDDELPYLPRHRGLARIGLSGRAWELSAALKHQAKAREEPGVGPIRQGLHADGYATADLTASWRLRESTLLQLVVGNVTDKAAIVSHRPFGARPNRPRWLTFRVRHRF
ncbi:MAG: TonB-dependent receptor [Gammaproteobacteria bacterium]|nr:TonB-dependent receptor [Gammaproteobacteria bacterium]MCY4344431.1 TonB-dependent receptor [Gammaproteobacteria bacterium]